MSMILSPTDERIQDLKYKASEKFQLKEDSLENSDYSPYMIRILRDEGPVIVEIDSYEISHTGEIGYRLRLLQPEYVWRWFVTEEILEEDFTNLGKDSKNLRFLYIDD